MDKEYMSGSELRQYLHISTRKMKYLMDYNYIPHQNTGQTTYKYLILRTDAEKFKYRMEYDTKLIDELSGHFSSHCKAEQKEKPSKVLLELTEENLKAFKGVHNISVGRYTRCSFIIRSRRTYRNDTSEDKQTGQVKHT